jgi:hypothetical protein
MCAAGPEVALSTPIPGMRWSTVLEVGSIGMRWTADQWTPSLEET